MLNMTTILTGMLYNISNYFFYWIIFCILVYKFKNYKNHE